MILIFYLTIVPKIIYLYLLYKIIFIIFTIDLSIINFLIILTILTVIISGIYGLYQRKIKKLLAYSSISHMAFIIIPILIDNSIFGLNLVQPPQMGVPDEINLPATSSVQA